MDPLNVGGMSLDALIEREWLITNGVGGYACSTSVGLNTRKYHGLLVAAMAPPAPITAPRTAPFAPPRMPPMIAPAPAPIPAFGASSRIPPLLNT